MRASPLGMRLFTRPAVAVTGTFTPASVSGLDYWLEADPTTLYTDSGTTLVTTDGDAIQQANDKTANARNLTQSTLANKPLYKVGTGGHHYIHCDGSNDFLEGGLVGPWQDGTGAHWFAISLQINSHSTGSGEHVIVKLVNGGTIIAYIYYIDNVIGLNVDNTFIEATGGSSDFTNGVPLVVIGTVTATAAELFLNNVSPDGATTLTGTRNTGNANLVIGSNIGIGAADVDIFGICHGQGALSSTDRGNLQTYLAGLHP